MDTYAEAKAATIWMATRRPKEEIFVRVKAEYSAEVVIRFNWVAFQWWLTPILHQIVKGPHIDHAYFGDVHPVVVVQKLMEKGPVVEDLFVDVEEEHTLISPIRTAAEVEETGRLMKRNVHFRPGVVIKIFDFYQHNCHLTEVFFEAT